MRRRAACRLTCSRGPFAAPARSLLSEGSADVAQVPAPVPRLPQLRSQGQSNVHLAASSHDETNHITTVFLAMLLKPPDLNPSFGHSLILTLSSLRAALTRLQVSETGVQRAVVYSTCARFYSRLGEGEDLRAAFRAALEFLGDGRGRELGAASRGVVRMRSEPGESRIECFCGDGLGETSHSLTAGLTIATGSDG